MEKRLEIIYRPLDSLKPYGNNPRRNEAAVEPVAASIREFGFKVPIVIDRGGVIVAGHARYKAAMQLQLAEVPCVLADDLSEEQVAAFRLADNRTSEFSIWDYEKEAEELARLVNMDLSAFQFPDFSLDLDVNDEDFFEDSKAQRQKRYKAVTCPHCGHQFDL